MPQASYTQNYLGQRVIKAAGGAATDFHYDRGGHLIAESDGAGNVEREYVFLDDTPIAFITPSGIDFIHPDHLGTPQKMTDANQNIVWDGGGSDPFMMSPLPTTPAMGLRFPGQYYDSETGLHYNYFRDYDPSIGRYAESDPIGLGGGINTYAYVGGNPVLYYDKDGRFWQIVGGALIGAAFGAAGDIARQTSAQANTYPPNGNSNINWSDVASAAALGAMGGALGGTSIGLLSSGWIGFGFSLLAGDVNPNGNSNGNAGCEP